MSFMQAVFILSCTCCRFPNEQHAKAWKRNQDLTMTVLPTRQASQIHYDLYERYINERHADGDMFPPSLDQFENSWSIAVQIVSS